MKYLKLFEDFYFPPNIDRKEIPTQSYDHWKQIIKDRLIDLDDQGYDVDTGYDSQYHSIIRLRINPPWQKSAMSNTVDKERMKAIPHEILDDLVSMSSELESNNLKLFRCQYSIIVLPKYDKFGLNVRWMNEYEPGNKDVHVDKHEIDTESIDSIYSMKDKVGLLNIYLYFKYTKNK